MTGKYLHQSIEAMTGDKKWAWKGTIKQMEAVFNRRPEWRDLDPERVPDPVK